METNTQFTPDYSPQDMIMAGVFGGIYFNDPKWLVDLPYQFKKWLIECPTQLWTNRVANPNVNAYKVLAGKDQATWENAGWIREQDPRGWFQWYVNYYYGRKSEDDNRQINRWYSFKARHMGMLRANLAKNKTPQNRDRLYPIIRQGLLQWGILTSTTI